MSNERPILGNLKRGLIFVLSAPSGTGKTSLVTKLKEEFPSVEVTVNCTTRNKRAEEHDGVDYHFISEADFKEKIKRGEFLEHVENYGFYYGSLKSDVERITNSGHHAFLVIDTLGAMQLLGTIEATFIFVLPPSKEEVKRRLSLRGTEAGEMKEQRLVIFEQELERASFYDYLIVNDSLETAYQVLRSIVISEEHRTRYRNYWRNV
jgi:guanylate kinase